MLETGITPSLSMILKPLPRYEIRPTEAALVIVDLQYYTCSRNEGFATTVRERGREKEFEYYFDRIDEIIPNVAELMAISRSKGVEVIHLISEGYTASGRDMAHEWKKQDILTPKGGNPIEPRLAPEPDDIVIRKLVSGGFAGSNIDFVLRNLGVKTLIVTGCVLNQCVENTVRAASNLGYDVILVSDGTATYTPELQRFGLEVMADQFANVWDAAEVMDELAPWPSARSEQRGPLAESPIGAGR